MSKMNAFTLENSFQSKNLENNQQKENLSNSNQFSLLDLSSSSKNFADFYPSYEGNLDEVQLKLFKILMTISITMMKNHHQMNCHPIY